MPKVRKNICAKVHLVYVEGKIRTRSWDDKEGNKRYATEIVADTMTMLSGRRQDDNSSNQSSENRNTQEESPSMDATNPTGDDLPF